MNDTLWFGFVPTIDLEIGAVLLLCLFVAAIFYSRKKVKPQAAPASTPKIKPDIKSLLAKTQEAFTNKLDSLILNTKTFDSSFLESLEELLYTSDLGPKTVEKLLLKVRETLGRGELSQLQKVKEALFEEISSILDSASVKSGNWAVKPWIVLVVGVNGVGKTTTIGKLAQYYSSLQRTVLIVAGDTFRAAAEEQLRAWGERAKVDVYMSTTTKDAAAVAFQGIQKGVSENKDVIIVDTAGRLHTKENLMEELKKVKRVVDKALPGAPHETILVIDANNGQNAKIQAQQFNEALGITSLVVTKLDGTARGGIIVSIADEVGVGVQFIGTGEKIGDLEKFSNQEYARGLLRM